jgi:hypothetical protein
VFAREARRENTRRAYKAAYRAFATARLGGRPLDVDDVDRDLVVAYRDHLSAAGAAPSTISATLSASRSLAAALELDPRIARVKTAAGEQPTVPALTEEEYTTLLEIPDRRARGQARLRAATRPRRRRLQALSGRALGRRRRRRDAPRAGAKRSRAAGARRPPSSWSCATPRAAPAAPCR